MDVNASLGGAGSGVDYGQRRWATTSSTPFPRGRSVQQYAVLLTGVTVQSSLTLNSVGGQDVGGATGNAYARMSIHGSRGVDQKVFISGLSTMLSAMSQDTPYIPNMGSTQEVTIDTWSGRSSRRRRP